MVVMVNIGIIINKFNICKMYIKVSVSEVCNFRVFKLLKFFNLWWVWSVV